MSENEKIELLRVQVAAMRKLIEFQNKQLSVRMGHKRPKLPSFVYDKF